VKGTTAHISVTAWYEAGHGLTVTREERMLFEARGYHGNSQQLRDLRLSERRKSSHRF